MAEVHARVSGSVTQFESLEPRRLLAATVLTDVGPARLSPYDYSVHGNHAPQRVTAVGDLNVFPAHDGRHGQELWRTDGTAAGTHMVADLVRGPIGSSPRDFVALGAHAFFFAGDALWRTDGTAGGTSKLQLDPDAQYFADPHGLTVFNGALVFADTDARGAARLWRSDGTADGYTRLLQQPGQAPPPSAAGAIGALHAVGDVLLFAQRDTRGEQWLWRTDGTPGGTFALHGGLYVFDHQLVRLGEELYFFGNSASGLRGTALWRTDGTRAGTEIIKRFSDSQRLSVAVGVAGGGALYFRGYDPSHGAELWKSDGTEAGTVLVKDLWTGAGSDAPSIFVPEYEPPPVPSYGSVDSVVIRTNPGPPPPNSSNPGPLASTPQGALFAATDGQGIHVYHTDGTPEGTVSLPLSGPNMRVTGVQRIGDAVFIAVQSSTYDNGAIFVTDGTVAGTRLVWNGSPRGTIHVHAVQTTQLSEVNGSLYFAGYTHTTGLELMRLNDTGGITGVAYDDANGNAVRDPSELPLVGWRAFLDRDGDGVFNRGEKFTFADERGAYGFPAYPDGDYTVCVTPAEDGWTSAATAATVRRGHTTSRDVGAARVTPAHGSVSGNAFHDADFDGAFDVTEDGDDRAFAGLRVYLDLNRNGYYTRGEPQAFTNASGDYQFDDVLPGHYRVAIVELGAGHEYTRGIDRMVRVRPNGSSVVDFGIGYDGSNGMIHGVVFDDRDGDSKRDANEPGLAGVTIRLGWAGGTGRSVTTDATGYYKFTRLRRGYHPLGQVALGGDWAITTATAPSVDLPPGQRRTVDFGNVFAGTSAVYGSIFNDRNESGVRDPDESGLAGVEVYLDMNRNGVRDPDEASTRTTASGEYKFERQFSHPDPGIVEFVMPDQWQMVNWSAQRFRDVRLTPNSRRDISPIPLAHWTGATGTVFLDRDRDGRRDAGEAGVNGISVWLDGDFDGEYGTWESRRTTGDGGRFTFRLQPGTYHLWLGDDRVTKPAPVILTVVRGVMDELDVALQPV